MPDHARRRAYFVRKSDGIHLNETGSSVAADIVVADLDKEFTH